MLPRTLDGLFECVDEGYVIEPQQPFECGPRPACAACWHCRWMGAGLGGEGRAERMFQLCQTKPGSALNVVEHKGCFAATGVASGFHQGPEAMVVYPPDSIRMR